MFNLRQKNTQNKNISRWTISTKINSLTSTILVLMSGLSCYFYFEASEISREIEEIALSDLPMYEIANSLMLDHDRAKHILLEIEKTNLLSAKDRLSSYKQIIAASEILHQTNSNKLLVGIEQAQFALQEEQKKEHKHRLNEEQENYQKLEDILLLIEQENHLFFLSIGQAIQENKSGSFQVYTNSLEQATVHLETSESLTLEIIQQLKDHIQGSLEATKKEKILAIETNFIIVVSAILFGLLASQIIVREITTSLKQVTQKARAIAESVNQDNFIPQLLEIKNNDEIGELSIAFNTMVEKFAIAQAEIKQISQQISVEKELAQWQASHDPLTGLSNRRDFEVQLTKICESKNIATHSLLYLDLDRFKIVNDTYGHAVGDELLKQVSQLLQAEIHDTATLSRLGGDEFAIILPQFSQDRALTVARKILSTIQEFCFRWQEQSFTIGVSIGLLSFDSQQDTVASLLKVADAACYSAKSMGRNRIHVMESELRRAQGEDASCFI